MRFIDSFISN